MAFSADAPDAECPPTYAWMDIDRWIDRCMDGWMDLWMDG
jgi:hypothetical protein